MMSKKTRPAFKRAYAAILESRLREPRRFVQVVDALPTLRSGKVDRSAVRRMVAGARGAPGSGWDAANVAGSGMPEA